MDFKTKTALCIARLYNSSACVFWLAQTPTERAQWTNVWSYWCRNKLEVVFSCRVPCLWAWSGIPRTPFPPGAGSCCSARAEFQLWAGQEGAPSWRHHLGAAAAAPGSGSVGTPELSRTMGNPPGLGIVSRWMCWLLLSPVLQQIWDEGSPGLQPRGRTTLGCCPHTSEEAPRGPQDRALQVELQKQSTKGITQQTCAHDKRKTASPLLSLSGILTWYFHNASELIAITNLAIQHL